MVVKHLQGSSVLAAQHPFFFYLKRQVLSFFKKTWNFFGFFSSIYMGKNSIKNRKGK
jgi:hypothetical protein